MYVLYEHINKINGKRYIGITNDINTRWRNKGIGYKPYRDRNSKFWSAIQKYGWENFTHNILLENLTFEEACIEEINEISKYDIRNDLYNISPGGNGGAIYQEHPKGMLGKSHSEEFRLSHSSRMKGENNPFYGKKWENYGGHPKGMLGKKHTDDNKKRISDTCKRKGINKKRMLAIFSDGSTMEFSSKGECADYFNISSTGALFIRLCKTGEPYKKGAKNQYTNKIKLPEGTILKTIPR